MQFDLTIRVNVEPGDETDGKYDGDPSPAVVSRWLGPWLAAYITEHAPYGVTAEYVAPAAGTDARPTVGRYGPVSRRPVTLQEAAEMDGLQDWRGE